MATPRGEGEHSGHRERMMRSFLEHGYDGMQPHHILELLLFFALPRVDTNIVAHRLIDTFGSLSGVFEASYEDLVKVKGIGFKSAVLLKVIVATSRAYLDDKQSMGIVLSSTKDIGEFMKPKFIGRNRETVFLLCFDKKHKLLKCELISEGALDEVHITMRSIVETVMKVGAYSVVLVHNHPQGFAVPSSDDINTTRALKRTLETLSIPLSDHIIVARDDFVSMAESGQLID